VLKALWFFIQVAVIAAGAIWIVQRDGRVSLELMGYTVGMQTGHFILGALVLFFILLFLFRLVRGILNIPSVVSDMHAKDKKARGFLALTRGFVAVAAGDTKKASQYAKQAIHYLPKQKGLPILLDAQAARMRGDDGHAKTRFEELLADKDTAFFGIRGLLKNAVDEHDYDTALEYANQAAKLHPKQGWVLKGQYDLQIKTGHYPQAQATLKKLVKLSYISKEQADSDNVAIQHIYASRAFARGEERVGLLYLEAAYKIDPFFAPTVCALGKKYLNHNKKAKALKIFKKAWAENPHPDLLFIWDAAKPIAKKKQSEKTLKWYADLVALKPDSALGQMAAAQAAMDLGLWGEAKAYLMMAEQLHPSARLYQMRAQVEQQATLNDDDIHNCMDKAARAMPDKVWVCRNTGMVYECWEPIAQPHGDFNSIIWDYPHARQNNVPQKAQTISYGNHLLIDPAA